MTLNQSITMNVVHQQQQPEQSHGMFGRLAGICLWVMSNAGLRTSSVHAITAVMALTGGILMTLYSGMGGNSVTMRDNTFLCISQLSVQEYNARARDCFYDNQGRDVDPLTGRAPECVFQPSVMVLNELPEEMALRFCVPSKVTPTDRDWEGLLVDMKDCTRVMVHDEDPESKLIVEGMNRCTKDKFSDAVRGLGLTLGEMQVKYKEPTGETEKDTQIKEALVINRAGIQAAVSTRDTCVMTVMNDIETSMSVWYMLSSEDVMNEVEKCMMGDRKKLGSTAVQLFDKYVEEGKQMGKTMYEIYLASDKMVSAIRWRNSGVGVGMTVATAASFSVGLQRENKFCVVALALYRQYWPAIYTAVTGAAATVYKEAVVEGFVYLFRLDRVRWQHELTLLKSAGMDRAVWSELFSALWARSQPPPPAPPGPPVVNNQPNPPPGPPAANNQPTPAPSGKQPRPKNKSQELKEKQEVKDAADKAAKDAAKAAAPVGDDERRDVDPDAMQRSLDKLIKELDAQKAKEKADMAKEVNEKAEAAAPPPPQRRRSTRNNPA